MARKKKNKHNACQQSQNMETLKSKLKDNKKLEKEEPESLKEQLSPKSKKTNKEFKKAGNVSKSKTNNQFDMEFDSESIWDDCEPTCFKSSQQINSHQASFIQDVNYQTRTEESKKKDSGKQRKSSDSDSNDCFWKNIQTTDTNSIWGPLEFPKCGDDSENSSAYGKKHFNAWDERLAKREAINKMTPQNSIEEEKMIQKAIELSKKEITIDEMKKKNIQLLYEEQCKVLEMYPDWKENIELLLDDNENAHKQRNQSLFQSKQVTNIKEFKEISSYHNGARPKYHQKREENYFNPQATEKINSSHFESREIIKNEITNNNKSENCSQNYVTNDDYLDSKNACSGVKNELNCNDKNETYSPSCVKNSNSLKYFDDGWEGKNEKDINEIEKYSPPPFINQNTIKHIEDKQGAAEIKSNVSKSEKYSITDDIHDVTLEHSKAELKNKPKVKKYSATVPRIAETKELVKTKSTCETNDSDDTNTIKSSASSYCISLNEDLPETSNAFSIKQKNTHISEVSVKNCNIDDKESHSLNLIEENVMLPEDFLSIEEPTSLFYESDDSIHPEESKINKSNKLKNEIEDNVNQKIDNKIVSSDNCDIKQNVTSKLSMKDIQNKCLQTSDVSEDIHSYLVDSNSPQTSASFPDLNANINDFSVTRNDSNATNCDDNSEIFNNMHKSKSQLCTKQQTPEIKCEKTSGQITDKGNSSVESEIDLSESNDTRFSVEKWLTSVDQSFKDSVSLEDDVFENKSYSSESFISTRPPSILSENKLHNETSSVHLQKELPNPSFNNSTNESVFRNNMFGIGNNSIPGSFPPYSNLEMASHLLNLQILSQHHAGMLNQTSLPPGIGFPPGLFCNTQSQLFNYATNPMSYMSHLQNPSYSNVPNWYAPGFNQSVSASSNVSNFQNLSNFNLPNISSPINTGSIYSGLSLNSQNEALAPPNFPSTSLSKGTCIEVSQNSFDMPKNCNTIDNECTIPPPRQPKYSYNELQKILLENSSKHDSGSSH